MPRFVAKEDVQKGLVDPKKPLHQQPEYQKKIESQQKTKQHKQEPTKQHKEEHKKEHKEEHKKHYKEGHEKHHKGEHKKQHKEEGQKNEKQEDKQRKPRRQRQDRPQFNWNRRQITIQTKAPEAPKKILPKPDGEKFKAELTKLKQLKENLFLERKKLIDEQKFLIKSNSDSKKSGFSALSKYGLELREKTNLKKSLFDKINKLQDEKKSIESQLQQLKDHNQSLRAPKELELMSSQQLKEKIANLQQRLSSANLDKKQQTQINNNINLAKRALIKARPDIEIKTELSKNDDKIKILYDDTKALKKQIDGYYKELKPIKQSIEELLKKKKDEEGVITEVKSIQDIKAEYDKKIKQIDAKREDAQKKMDELKIKYNKDLDLYEDQQDLLRYIKYVQDEIDYKKKRQQEDERRRKQKQEKEAKQKKQYEERQRKRQQRKKQQEQRQKREEERKQKLQAEREAFLNRNPNWQTIDMCEFMIKYCENIRPQNEQNRPAEEKNAKTEVELNNQKGWEKEVKSGCQVIVSKKNKADEQAPKKIKKQKKPKTEDANESFNHSIDTINRFHQLNVLPPLNASEIDQTIKQLQDKIEILKKPSQQEIDAFKVKASKEFDRLHGFHEEDEKEHDEEKPVRHENKRERSQKVELKGADFPELN